MFSDHNAMKLSQPQEKIWPDCKYMEVKEHPIEELTRKLKETIKKYMEANENENTTVQNFWDAAKVVLRGNYIAI